MERTVSKEIMHMVRLAEKAEAAGRKPRCEHTDDMFGDGDLPRAQFDLQCPNTGKLLAVDATADDDSGPRTPTYATVG